MFYRVEIVGRIYGDMLNNPDVEYNCYITQCETLDKEYKTNCIYKTENKFQYSIYLDQPTSVQIIEAKNLIKQKMLCQLNNVLNNLEQIKYKLEKQITFE